MIVILTVSSLKASSSGEGRKSGFTSRGPIGSLVYFVFALINVFAFAQVLFHGNNLGFSAAVVFCGKAQRAGNGPILADCCNAASGYHRSARRVGLSTSIAALRLLPRTKAIRCETRLAMNCLVLGRTTSTYCKSDKYVSYKSASNAYKANFQHRNIRIRKPTTSVSP